MQFCQSLNTAVSQFVRVRHLRCRFLCLLLCLAYHILSAMFNSTVPLDGLVDSNLIQWVAALDSSQRQ